MEHCYALLVGIDHYTDNAHFVPLAFAQADALALYQFLTDPVRGGWRVENVVYLAGEAATRDEIESQLREICLVRAEEDALVLLYFAGHAFFDLATGDGYLALPATTRERPATGLHLPTLVDHYLSDARAANMLMMLDIHRTGAGWQPKTGGDLALFGQALRYLPDGKGRVILSSGREAGPTREQTELGHGLYMARLLDALGGAAANPRTGRVTLGTLYDYFAEKLEPELTASAYPRKFGNESGPMILIERPEWRIGDLATFQNFQARGQAPGEIEITPLHVLSGHHGHVDDVVFSPDGARLASCGADMTVRLWSTQSGELLRTIEGHEGATLGVDFSYDGRLLASCSEDKTVRLWKAKNGEALQVLRGHHSAVWTVAFAPDNTLLASCSNDERVLLWHPPDGGMVRELEGHHNVVVGVDFSFDSRWLASCSFDKTICVWDARSGSLQRTLRYSDIVYGVSWSPDGTLLASCSADGTICLWNVASGQPVQTLTGHEGAVWTIDFSADGRLLVSGSEDGSLKLWDVYQGREVRGINQRSEVYGVTFGAQNLLANSAEDGTARVWRVVYPPPDSAGR